MTDNEIIKALQICGDQTIEDGHCINCPCKDACYGEEGLHALEKAALDLIQRQQAELDRLERHTKMHDEIQAEAVKEFAERLKNEIISETAYGCDTNQHSGYYDYSIKIGDIPEYIENLVKEMVGESDDR